MVYKQSPRGKIHQENNLGISIGNLRDVQFRNKKSGANNQTESKTIFKDWLYNVYHMMLYPWMQSKLTNLCRLQVTPRLLQCCQLPQNNTKTVYIWFFIRWFITEHFRCHPLRLYEKWMKFFTMRGKCWQRYPKIIYEQLNLQFQQQTWMKEMCLLLNGKDQNHRPDWDNPLLRN